MERFQDRAIGRLIEQIPLAKFPEHVLIIPDGNGRWASKFNKDPSFGHVQGTKVLKNVLDSLRKLPIKFVTVWGFASDNWKRSPEEINPLMQIFEEQISLILPRLIQDDIKFVHLGRKDRIPDSLREAVDNTEELTRKNSKQVLSLAIDFGGDDQLMRMMRDVRYLPKEIEITSAIIQRLRDGQGEIPPADLIIRTSGEQRVPDIGWLGTNSEFYSIKKLLPDSRVEDFIFALFDYSKRSRRFGARPQLNNS